MEAIIPVNINEGTTEPQFGELKAEWFEKSNDIPTSALKAKATDKAFMFIRQHEEPKSTWKYFNRRHSQMDPEKPLLDTCLSFRHQHMRSKL